MKVECVHCGASGQMDESKIPPGVTSIKCPRCKESFPIPDKVSPNVIQSSPPPLQPPIFPQTAPSPAPFTPPPVAASTSPRTASAAMANCSVCADQFPRDEMVRFGTAWVCAACKPSYVQMLAQGTSRPGEMRYAGFGIRFGAKILDGLILWVVNIVLTFIIGFSLPKATPQTAIVSSIVMLILQMGLAAAYSGFFLEKYRATPGKMACGLTVVTPEGQQISFWRGAGRYFAEILSSMILLVGYLMALFDEEKRALHDRICNTRVVYK
jgi:predicted Zn finger-like uncharacterized protein